MVNQAIFAGITEEEKMSCIEAELNFLVKYSILVGMINTNSICMVLAVDVKDTIWTRVQNVQSNTLQTRYSVG